ncbi:hypothetical protein LTR56_004249 [Elasticomyces elasticus]|nr:hypothetical protein LTR56_004249 [Elasticomyces elasticus]KAK3655138.1 hypothetical protein LTR22_010448 [Elasticomyces elasticus]KAK4904560.1 hypothetical protein LTR49_026004 [Elasticomyces elasticus]KAK5750586.1 hypothetical protein LTS12_019376 [Elasticomyces elasticus]
MRLLRVDTLEFEERDEPVSQALAEYAVLSHTWNYGHEVLFENMALGTKDVAALGYNKILSTCKQAAKDGLKYVWCDTCCLDKRSSSELQETINSMYRFYALSAICYVYLEDVEAGPDWEEQLRNCRWLTRAWCLQELIAPLKVMLYDKDWILLSSLQDAAKLVSSITGLDVRLLQHKREPGTYSVAQRMSWAANRHASRLEDVAYSLLGIFDVNLTMLYGEGPKAFRRLQEEIMRVSTDHSIFAWDRPRNGDDREPRGVLPASPADFSHCGRIGRLSGLLPGAFQLTSRGLKIPLPLANDHEASETVLALLDCYRSGPTERPYFALELQPLPKLLNPRNYRVDPALFAAHATDAYLVTGLRHLTEEDFKQYSDHFRAEKISLFGSEDFRTMNMFTPGNPGSKTWMTPVARYTRG